MCKTQFWTNDEQALINTTRIRGGQNDVSSLGETCYRFLKRNWWILIFHPCSWDCLNSPATEVFPGGPVVKKQPDNAGDTWSLTCEDSPITWNNQAQAPQLLSLYSRVWGTATTGPTCHSYWSPCSATREATAMRSLLTATREEPPLAARREKPTRQQRPSVAKNK